MSTVEGSHHVVNKFFNISEERAASLFRLAEFVQVDDEHLTTYLLTPWSRVLRENLTVNFAASQSIPHIYGTRKFLTVPTSARHLSLS
jgi:hypothetical protein